MEELSARNPGTPLQHVVNQESREADTGLRARGAHPGYVPGLSSRAGHAGKTGCSGNRRIRLPSRLFKGAPYRGAEGGIVAAPVDPDGGYYA
jgi:hypothetical protein